MDSLLGLAANFLVNAVWNIVREICAPNVVKRVEG